MKCGRNYEGYSDPTASIAIGRVTREEKQRNRRRMEEKKDDERNHQDDGEKSKK